uniref:CMP/dCMP-type deaminase domain-containing protein n=1 Tax=Panagrellus redivivus TaxID=6233 RepID=A0A7E4ZW58_PANRE
MGYNTVFPEATTTSSANTNHPYNGFERFPCTYCYPMTIMFHQALVGLTPRNFEINVRKSITRGSSMKVFVPGYKSKYKRSFFSYRAARFFTKLPRSVQSISKHKAFVASLLV